VPRPFYPSLLFPNCTFYVKSVRKHAKLGLWEMVAGVSHSILGWWETGHIYSLRFTEIIASDYKIF